MWSKTPASEIWVSHQEKRCLQKLLHVVQKPNKADLSHEEVSATTLKHGDYQCSEKINNFYFICLFHQFILTIQINWAAA